MPLPQLVTATRRTARHHLKKLLPEFFKQLDDSLFDLADKAENNQLQNLYFDAMRTVRLKKDDMSNAWRRQLDALFNESLQGAGAPDQGSGEFGSLDQIGLVEDAQLEEELALSNMISAAETLYREPLYALTARYDFLIEDMEIDKDNNPLRPEVICQAFSAAVDELTDDLKIRLVIYKQFERHVVQQLGEMYDAINADLVAAGVLPRIKTPAQKAAEERRSAQAGGEADILAGIASAMARPADDSGDADAPAIAGGDLFASLQQMLSRQRAVVTGGVPGAGAPLPTGGLPAGAVATAGSPVAGAPAGVTGAGVDGEAGGETLYYAPQDIVGALSGLQASPAFTAPDGRQQAGEQPSATLIKATLVQAMGDQGEDDRQLGQADADAIDIVSMLFDFILDDPHVPEITKNLIARLQIPMVKVAILDKEFFARKTHPARQLLNELAYAEIEEGESLDGEEQSPTLQMMEYVVGRILEEFEDDTALFDSLLEEFTRFVEEEREANRLAEEMLEQARETVAEEIRQRLDGQEVPPFIRALLIDAWREVLNHIYLRDGGPEGSAWETALKVADDLIWSVQPKLVVSERQALIRTIPRVLNGLRDGLTLIAYDHDVTERIFARLEALHLASLRGGVAAAQAQRSAQATDAGAEPMDDSPPAAEAETTAPAIDDDLEEIVLASTQPMDWDGWDQGSDYAGLVKDMSLGTWVEFIDPESEKRRRGKLAWKCDFTGEYTFVDRKYKVVADLTFRKLLEEFDLGRARVVEDVPLFDRALDSVISGIKRAMEGRGEDAPTTH